MNIKQIEEILENSGIEKNEAKTEAKMLIEHFCKISSIKLAIDKGEFKDENGIILEKAKLRASSKRPIQQIIGSAYFMGEDFIVNENTLIPRDETEILVRKAIEIITENKFQQILDIGTGTGIIACMIAKRTEAKALGTDISSDALQIALDNSSKLNLFNKAIFRKSDLFSNVRESEKFDVIISNPPYIPIKEKGDLQKEVEFDPQIALFASDEKGIEFYEKITEQAPKYLNKNGYLMFELGINQAEDVKNLMIKNGFENIEIIKDLAYIDRVIFGRMK